MSSNDQRRKRGSSQDSGPSKRRCEADRYYQIDTSDSESEMEIEENDRRVFNSATEQERRQAVEMVRRLARVMLHQNCNKTLKVLRKLMRILAPKYPGLPNDPRVVLQGSWLIVSAAVQVRDATIGHMWHRGFKNAIRENLARCDIEEEIFFDLHVDEAPLSLPLKPRRYDNKRMLVREYYRQLHYLPAVSSQCVTELAKLVDGFSRLVHGLRKLKEPIESWDTPLSNLLLLKLDDATILAWENHSVHFGKDIYNDLISFIEDRIQILKATSRFNEEGSNVSAKGVSPIKVAGGRQSASRRTLANAATAKTDTEPPRTVQQPKCALGCLDSHLLRTCSVFNGKDVQDRRKIVSANGLCWNCLSPSHQVKQCNSEFSCRLCRERHHTLLHFTSGSAKVTMSVQSDDDMVFLETVWLTLIDDYGSMSNFMSESMARRLITTRNKVNISVSGIGKTKQMVKGTLSTTVQSRIRPYSSTMEFFVLDTPASAIPTTFIDVSTWHIPDVPLADSTFHIPGNVDIVIGGDMYWELHSGHKRSLGNGKPWLVETPFGWVVTGNSASNSTTHSTCHFAATDASLELFMERFWQGETITQEPTLSAEEQICENLYTTTTTRDSSGRYTVKLLFKSNANLILGTSKEVADRRLMSVERRLKGNPKMKEAYQKFMNEYEQLGHMERLTEPIDDSVQHYYIPHHAVVKEASTTTKVRVVFDASCKTSAGTSLNDMLLVGPVVQQDVYAIMLRFRSHPIALVAHVEKMYRQILHDASSHSLRELKIPRATLVTFSAATLEPICPRG
ncbi:uncharacterized protein LOC128276174 [Anopheles cruzii]|uniref:uncharacterized protein LOC128276174 n=1 Tax=Anopheles cruzii TaxID=68878 RepID=UPI0022EC6632|nr:uncharacterized protein LOC128276174 [Anopheles cruzii]